MMIAHVVVVLILLEDMEDRVQGPDHDLDLEIVEDMMIDIVMMIADMLVTIAIVQSIDMEVATRSHEGMD